MTVRKSIRYYWIWVYYDSATEERARTEKEIRDLMGRKEDGGGDDGYEASLAWTTRQLGDLLDMVGEVVEHPFVDRVETYSQLFVPPKKRKSVKSKRRTMKKRRAA